MAGVSPIASPLASRTPSCTRTLYYARTVYDSSTVYERQIWGGGPVRENEDEDVFVPLRPLIGGARESRERDRERRIADHVSRRREHAGQPPRRVRGLSLSDIVDTAVAVADADGTEAVSMRRIARELRVGAMSLYWYVASKDELHQLMLERVQAESEAPEPSGDWRADLRGYA